MKRGVSPLIASVLLLMIALFIGVTVVVFTQRSNQGFIDDATRAIDRDLKCSLDLSLSLLVVNGEKSICYNRTGNNNIEFIVQNQGTTDAEGVRIFVLDFNDTIYSQNSLQKIGSHNRTRFDFNFSNQILFPPTKVTITPLVKAGTSTVACTDSEIEVEQFRKCT